MPKIKSLDRIRKKWVDSTQANQAEYEEGVRNPKKDWATETTAAASNYATGIQKAIADKRFEKGVSKAGTSKWQEKTLEKGPTRWAQGVALSASEYEQGFAKYHAIISGLTLPPRGPKGDPKNIQRVAVIADALHKAKISGGA